MINGSVKVLCGMFVAMSVVSVQAASTGVEAENWVAGGEATITSQDGVIKVSFPAGSYPDPQLAGVDADESVAPNAFVGNYLEAGIKGLSFRLMVESGEAEMPKGVSLFIIGGADDTRWTISDLVFNEVSGTWVANNIEIGATRGAWYHGQPRGQAPLDLDALWTDTITDVKLIGLDLSRRGLAAQSYSITDFRFIGDGFISDPALLARVQDHLNQTASNVDKLTAAQMAQDSDGDGVSDYDAIMAGQDPGLAVKIVSVEADGITLEWPKAANRKYTLLRCSSLKDGFTEVVLDGGFENESGVKTYKDTTATGDVPYFYRVVKKEN